MKLDPAPVSVTFANRLIVICQCSSGDANVGVDLIIPFCKALIGFDIEVSFAYLPGSLNVFKPFRIDKNIVVMWGIGLFKGLGVRNKIFSI